MHTEPPCACKPQPGGLWLAKFPLLPEVLAPYKGPRKLQDAVGMGGTGKAAHLGTVFLVIEGLQVADCVLAEVLVGPLGLQAPVHIPHELGAG